MMMGLTNKLATGSLSVAGKWQQQHLRRQIPCSSVQFPNRFSGAQVSQIPCSSVQFPNRFSGAQGSQIRSVQIPNLFAPRLFAGSEAQMRSSRFSGTQVAQVSSQSGGEGEDFSLEELLERAAKLKKELMVVRMFLVTFFEHYQVCSLDDLPLARKDIEEMMAVEPRIAEEYNDAILALVAKLQKETVEPTFVTLYYRVLNLLHKVRFYRHIVDLLLQENRTCHRDDVELSNTAIKYAMEVERRTIQQYIEAVKKLEEIWNEMVGY